MDSYDYKDYVCLIVVGPSEKLKEAIDRDLSLLKSAFGRIARVHIKQYTDFQSGNQLEVTLMHLVKKHKTVIFWYTGHGLNAGSSSPSIYVSDTTEACVHLYDSVKSYFNQLTIDVKREKCFVMFIDACNSFKITPKHLIERELYHYQHEIESIGLSSSLMSDWSGHLCFYSSDHKKDSLADSEGSLAIQRMLRELSRTNNWVLAARQTRSKLFNDQEPYFEAHLNVKPKLGNMNTQPLEFSDDEVSESGSSEVLPLSSSSEPRSGNDVDKFNL